MALRRTLRRLVTYQPVRYTKDGRVRAQRPQIGPHHQSKIPFVKLSVVGLVALHFGRKWYNESSYVPPGTQFLNKVNVVPYGGLGTSFALTGTQRNITGKPDEDTVLVDPTTIEVIKGVSDGAVGTSGSIYHAYDIVGAFPDDVANALWKQGDAKMFDYNGRKVIHVINPDFQFGNWTEREASMELARAYRNVLHEFAMSSAKVLRLVPLGGSQASGPLYNQIPPLTQEALHSAFEQLHAFDKETLLRSDRHFELCIFMEREWDAFAKVFTMVTPPKKLE